MLSARCSGYARPYESFYQHLHFAWAYLRSRLERAGPSHDMDLLYSVALFSNDGLGANFRFHDHVSRV